MRNPMRTIVAITAVTVLVIPAALGAGAGDPDDVAGGIDIARSAIRTVETAPGVFRIRLKAVAFDPLELSSGVGSIYWQLDSRGGDAPDYEAYVFGDPKTEPALCLFRSLRAPHEEYVKVAVSGRVAVCAFPKRFIEITKAVRWRLAGRSQGVIDRAPNTGWYGG
jgi:hypothetical protein